MKRWLGSGPSRKSSSVHHMEADRRGSGCRSRNSRLVMPPTSASARSAAGIASKAAQMAVASGPYSFSSKTRSRTSALASGMLDAREQVAEEVHGDAAVAQHVGEAVVLLPRAAHPQHVVEEQRVLVAGGEPLQLQIRSVQDDPAQPPGLGVDAIECWEILPCRWTPWTNESSASWWRTPAAASRRSARPWVSRRPR